MLVFVVLMVGANVLACTSTSRQHRPIRYGSLVADDRIFDYAHRVETLKLPNGLLVALVPDERANLVAVDVRYLVGHIEDPDDKRGLAHLVEHMMFEQRKAAGEPTTAEQLATIALRHNATTSWDATHYHTLALASQLDALLALEAGRMRNGCAGLDQAAFDHERAIVAQETTQRGTSDVVDAVMGSLYGARHTYTRRATTADLARLTLADVCSFIDAHYAPDRAILVVAGRLDSVVVKAALAKQFAPIARRARSARTTTALEPMSGAIQELHGETDEPTAMIVVPAAPWGSPEAFNDQLVDGLIMAELAKIDRETPWITDIATGHLGGAVNGARYFAVSVNDPRVLDQAIAEVFRTARELSVQDSGLVLGVLAARRRDQLFDEFESIDDRGEHCADYLQRTSGRQFHLRELKALQAIDTDQLSARAMYMTRQRSHIFRILPNKAVGRVGLPQLEAAAGTVTDGPGWRAPVDVAEAHLPVALPAARRELAVTERRLSNGMRLVMANDFTQPIVEARLVFPIGEHGAGRDRTVLAHAAASLLEHDTTRGFTFKDFTLINWVLRLGAQMSAEVDDHTTFKVRGTSTFADWHVWRLHWLLDGGHYAEEDLARVREAAKRHEGLDHGRSWRRALRAAMLGDRAPEIAASKQLGQLQIDELEQFRQAHYRARDATLIVVGKFDAAVMERTVEELFGAWSDAPSTAPATPKAIDAAAGPIWIAHADPEAAQVRITASFSATSKRAASRGARAIVGAMVADRVAQIRSRLGASYGVQASYATTEVGDLILIDGLVDAARAGEVLRHMRADLQGLHAGDDAVAADFVRARRAALAESLADPLEVSSVADELEDAVAHRHPIDDAATLPAAIAGTTLADVRAVLAADLAPARMVVMLSGPPDDTTAALRAADITTYRTVAAD